MEFRVLGPLQAAGAGGIADLGGPRARALLAALVLRANQPVWVERLAEDVWPEGPPPSASATLKAHLSRLRAALVAVEPGASGCIGTGRGTYELHVEPGGLDSAQFEQLTTDGREAIQGRSFADARVVLGRALALWRGEPYIELDGVIAAQPEITRLVELRRVAEDDLIDARLGLGEHDAVVAELERHVANEPMRERRIGQLMRALYGAGRQVDALRTYERFRRALSEELGLEPGPALRELEQAILLQRPELVVRGLEPGGLSTNPSAPARPEPPPSPLDRMAATPMFGRVDELATVLRAIERINDGEQLVIGLEGEAGMGKTRLLAELRTAVQDRVVVLYGQSDRELTMPYQPVVAALDHAVGHLRDRVDSLIDATGGALAELLPSLSELRRPMEAAGRAEPETERYRLFEALRRVLEMLGGDRPVLLVIDDAHDADRESIRLARFLVTQGVAGGIGVLLAFRGAEVHADNPMHDLLEDCERDRRLEQVELTGLAAETSRQLVRQHAPANVTEDEIARLAASARGNPLFLEELARGAAHGRSLSVPARLSMMMERRMGTLSAECQSLLDLAAIIGREQRLDVITMASSLTEPQVFDALEEAFAAQVLMEIDGQVGRYTFAHPLFAEVRLDSLSRTKRARLHRDVLDALDACGTATTAELARHAVSSGPLVPPEQAAALSRRAGDEALGLAGFDEAALHFQAALAMLDAGPDLAASRAELQLAIGHARAASTEENRAGDAFRAAAASARTAGRSDLLAEAALGLRTTYAGELYGFGSVGASDKELVALLEEALAALPADARRARAMLLSRLAQARYWDVPAATRKDWADEAVQLAEGDGDERALGVALVGRRYATWAPGGAIGRLGDAERLLDLGRTASATDLQMEALRWLIFDRLELGDVDGLIEAMALHDRMAEQVRRPVYRGYTQMAGAMLALLRGSYAEAMTRAERARELFTGIGLQLADSLHGAQVLVHNWDTGNLDALAGDIAAIAAEVTDLPAVECALAFVAAETDQLAAAQDLIDRLAPHEFAAIGRDVSWTAACALLAVAVARVGDADRAGELARQLGPLSGTLVVVGPPAAASLGPVDLYLGLLADCAGDRDAAIEHLERAARLAEAMGARPAHARAGAALAQVLGRGTSRDRRRATALRERANLTATEIGLVLPRR